MTRPWPRSTGTPMALLTPVGAGALLVGRDVVGLATGRQGLLRRDPLDAWHDHRLAAEGWSRPQSGLHRVQARAPGHVRDLAHAGGAADGVRRDRRGLDRASARRPAAPDFAAGLLRRTSSASACSLAITIALLWERLAFHGPGPARLIPTLWIVLGPLGPVRHRRRPTW